MRRLLLAPFVFASMTIGPVAAADLPLKAVPPEAHVWSWSGLYLGGHTGALWSSTKFSDPLGPSLFGDSVQSPGFFAGGQIGYNWQQAASPWVFGLEAEASALDSDGTVTCFAASGIFVSATCRMRPRTLGSVTGRVGYALGLAGRTLLYAKGGAAWMRDAIDITTNNLFFSGATIATGVRRTTWGWTAGAGVERALTPAWSLRLEYDYLRFGDFNIATPASETVTPAGVATPVPGNVSSAAQQLHLLKIAVNYRWGQDPRGLWDNRAPRDRAPALPVKVPRRAVAWAPGWDIEIGPRYSYSFNRFQWDNAGAVGGLVQSRLTYDDRKTHAGELFGRIDSPWGVFVKGFVGGGKTHGGHMNDEDWGLPVDADTSNPVAYTNTLSGKVDGSSRYATGDIGYSWLEGLGYKLSTFVGYNYFKEKMNAFGCIQTASPDNPGAPCASGPPVPIAGSPIITQRAEWQSLRLGVVGDYMLTDRLKLTAEVAYLPYVKLTAEDNHFLGNTGVLFRVFPQSGHGAGVQLEAMLAYAVTDQFSIGVGGRYWAMWTTQARFCSYDAGAAPCTPLAPAKAATEQAGLLVQGSYKFNIRDAVVARY